MAKNIIFLIHGVGQHGDGWATENGGPVPALQDAALYYRNFSADAPLDNSVIFHPIRYDDIFDEICGQWSQLATDLKGHLKGFKAQDMSKAKAATESAAEAKDQVDDDDEASWFITSALDVPLYTHFKAIQKLVQLRVTSEMMQAIAKYRLEDGDHDRKFIVIGHSLGTTIAHDAIHLMGATPWLEDTGVAHNALKAMGIADVSKADLNRAAKRYGPHPFGPDVFQFRAVLMLANTSLLLHQTDKGPKNSLTRPKFAKGDIGRMCEAFYNIDHFLDPVGKIAPFRAETTWPRATMRGTALDILNVRHIHDLNVHGFAHYIANPLVHREILYAAAPHRFDDTDLATAADRLGADGDFPQWGEKFQDEDIQEKVFGSLEKLGFKEFAADNSGYLKMLEMVPAVLKEAKEHV